MHVQSNKKDELEEFQTIFDILVYVQSGDNPAQSGNSYKL